MVQTTRLTVHFSYCEAYGRTTFSKLKCIVITSQRSVSLLLYCSYSISLTGSQSITAKTGPKGSSSLMTRPWYRGIYFSMTRPMLEVNLNHITVLCGHALQSYLGLFMFKCYTERNINFTTDSTSIMQRPLILERFTSTSMYDDQEV